MSNNQHNIQNTLSNQKTRILDKTTKKIDTNPVNITTKLTCKPLDPNDTVVKKRKKGGGQSNPPKIKIHKNTKWGREPHLTPNPNSRGI